MIKKTFLALLLACTTALAAPSTPSVAIPEIQLLENPGFENGKASYSNSGGTFAINTSTPMVGKASATFTASAGSQYIASKQYTIASGSGLVGATCSAKVLYKTTETTNVYTLQLLDGSSNVLSSKVLYANAGTPSEAVVAAPCPAVAGSFGWKILSSGSAAALTVDEAALGKLKLYQLNQAQQFGSMTSVGVSNCSWSNSSSSYASFSADSDCNSPVLTGNASSAGKTPALTFSRLPAGDYLVVVSGVMYPSGSDTNTCSYQISDGTNASGFTMGRVLSAYNLAPGTMVGRFSYSSDQSNITFNTQAKYLSGTPSCLIENNSTTAADRFQMTVLYFPSASQSAFPLDSTPAQWTGYLTHGGQGNTTSTSYVDITNTTSPVLNELTNTNFGTVSLAASQIGLSLNFPHAGVYEICAAMNVSASTTGIWSNIRLMDGSGTIINPGVWNQSQNGASMVEACGSYNAASTATTVIKVQGATSSGTSFFGVINGPGGTAGVMWRIKDLTAASGSLYVTGNLVTSNTSSNERIERAEIANGGSCSITSQSGSWVSSVSHSATGQCTLTIPANLFSSAPTCLCNAWSGTGNASSRVCSQDSGSTSTSLIINTVGTGFSGIDLPFRIVCMGPK